MCDSGVIVFGLCCWFCIVLKNFLIINIVNVLMFLICVVVVFLIFRESFVGCSCFVNSCFFFKMICVVVFLFFRESFVGCSCFVNSWNFYWLQLFCNLNWKVVGGDNNVVFYFGVVCCFVCFVIFCFLLFFILIFIWKDIFLCCFVFCF